MITFVDFMDDLSAEISGLLKDIETSGPEGEPVQGFTVLQQELPDLEIDLTDPSADPKDILSLLPCPYALVRVYDGETEEFIREGEFTYEGWWILTAEIQLGLRWRDSQNQGHVKLLQAIQCIVDRFAKNRYLGGRGDRQYALEHGYAPEDVYKYVAMQDMKWAVQDSDDFIPPYYFGGVAIRFWVPKIAREEGKYT